MKGMDITVIILTFNEEMHIERCIRSVQSIARQIFIVDSFSTDRTVEIAKSLGAVVAQRKWKNYADQFQWGLNHYAEYCNGDTQWIMRLDADEYITPQLREELRKALMQVPAEVTGFIINRCVHFKGHPIRHGGHYHKLLRVWRHGKAKIEATWMDEHMVPIEGRVVQLRGEIHEDNLNNITWWTDKHNRYASREAVDLLNKEYHFLPETGGARRLVGQARVRRWLKENLYIHLPQGWRALGFYLYRIIFRLGFLDGRAGMVFHFLQGFWYRFLVDVKVWEVKKRMRRERIDCVEAIRQELGIDLLKRVE
jgi:glycosyltransferase involved in cell wall biosynthesis